MDLIVNVLGAFTVFLCATLLLRAYGRTRKRLLLWSGLCFLGLTLSNMSDRTGVSLGYLSQIELGKNSASIETLYRIALGLRVRVADLFQAVQTPL